MFVPTSPSLSQNMLPPSIDKQVESLCGAMHLSHNPDTHIIRDILMVNCNKPNNHKTDIWCRGLIAVSLDDQS